MQAVLPARLSQASPRSPRRGDLLVLGCGVPVRLLVQQQAAEEERQIAERREEEPPCVLRLLHARVRRREDEPGGGGEHDAVEGERLDSEHAAGEAGGPHREGERRHVAGILEADRRRPLAGRISSRKHLVPARGVVGAVHPREGEEVRDLPQEERARQQRCLRTEQLPPRRCPPHEGRHGAHDGADPCVVVRHRLERRVHARV
mmetsp:Transcript_42940/g.139334  ORF Transcript_42940/g.139334 Transcript_42940/m.139334 type:complete len:204 (+) Transcript_42940:526-1137(+)